MLLITFNRRGIKNIKRLFAGLILFFLLGGIYVSWFINKKADETVAELAQLAIENWPTVANEGNKFVPFAIGGVPQYDQGIPKFTYPNILVPYDLGKNSSTVDPEQGMVARGKVVRGNIGAEPSIPIPAVPPNIIVSPEDKTAVIRVIVARLNAADLKILVSLARGGVNEEEKQEALTILRSKLTVSEYDVLMNIAKKYKKQLQR